MTWPRSLLMITVLVSLLFTACCGSSRPARSHQVIPTPTSRPGSASVHLSPDGTGDFPSLSAALDSLPEGSTIILEAGTYYLPESLSIFKPVRLVGAGMEQTRIVSEAEGYVVRFNGAGPFAVEDLSFRHEGQAPADVVVVQGGGVTLTRCRFSGAVYRPGRQSGAGLRLQENTSGQVQACVAAENEKTGITVEGQAQPTLSGNHIHHNASLGLAYEDQAGGLARQNECSNNGLSGISVDGQAEPVLEENLCAGNKVSGIAYLAAAGGLAKKNDCWDSLIGISVDQQAKPRLEENYCHDNQEFGIFYWEQTKGTACRNNCSENKVGIGVFGQARPQLEANSCTNNELAGIDYGKYSGGLACQNECTYNGKYGIAVTEQARPILDRNICNYNDDTGITYWENSGGMARQNSCSGNLVGISITGSADPDLKDNDCHHNIKVNVLDRGL